MTDSEQSLRERAVKLLSRREHSRLELSLKLQQRGYDESLIDRVLDDLEERGWLSDERFAALFVRNRLEQGYGPLRIRAELAQRGIHSDPEGLRDVPESDWVERARAVRQRRFGDQPTKDPKARGRQGRFLAQRGFSGEQISRVLEESLSFS